MQTAVPKGTTAQSYPRVPLEFRAWSTLSDYSIAYTHGPQILPNSTDLQRYVFLEYVNPFVKTSPRHTGKTRLQLYANYTFAVHQSFLSSVWLWLFYSWHLVN
jgi:hypothetical protein